MNNIVTLSYLVKMGVTHSKALSDISKEIWDYLLAKGITITAEYLPGAINKKANFHSWLSERFKQMEVGLQSLLNNMQEEGAYRHRSFCFQNFPLNHLDILQNMQLVWKYLCFFFFFLKIINLICSIIASVKKIQSMFMGFFKISRLTDCICQLFLMQHPLGRVILTQWVSRQTLPKRLDKFLSCWLWSA